MLQSFLVREFSKRFGPLWEPDARELADKHGDAYLADSVRHEIQAVFASPQIRAQLPRLIAHVLILSRAETRCFVWPAPNGEPEYVLAMHIGTFANIRSLLEPQELWNPFRRDLPFLTSLLPADFLRLVTHMVVSALAYHEVAHIMRGHTRYIEEAKARHDEVEATRRRKLCEADADKWSSYILGGDILHHARAISVANLGHDGAHQTIISELLQVLAVALYRCFAVFNRADFPPPSLYPHPLLRATSVAIGTADNVEHGDVEFSNVLRRLTKVLTGLSRGEGYVRDQLASIQRRWDIGTELLGFEHEYASALAELERELAVRPMDSLIPLE
jgi:hypothetical protein